MLLYVGSTMYNNNIAIAQQYDTNHNIYSMLATKTFQHLSIREWVQTRKDSGQVSAKNELCSLRQSLLVDVGAHRLQVESGAYVDVENLFNRVVDTYTAQHAFTGDKTFWWKLSSDNRRLYHHNQVWTLSPHNVYQSQSPLHVYDIMVARIPERHIPFTTCVGETNMEGFLPTIEDTVITYQSEEISNKLFIGGDWMTHVCELKCLFPNTTSFLGYVCWRCAIDKQYLRTGYLEDPFQWHGEALQISDFPNATYDFAPLESRRYCPMHGVSNMLSNFLKSLFDDLPLYSKRKALLKNVMHRVKHGWDPKQPLSANVMKEFFRRNLHKEVSQLFVHPCKLHKLAWPTTPHSFWLTTAQVVEMGLDSIRVYKQYVYKQHPSTYDYNSLLIARDCILTTHAHFKWPQAPTTHFLTNHSLHDFGEDGTAFHTLQEGTEAQNRDDKAIGREAFKADATVTMHESPSQYILNQQTLKQLFTHYGYAPPSHQLPTEPRHNPLITVHEIEPPIYAPPREYSE